MNRRTERANAGNPPDRFGDLVESSTRRAPSAARPVSSIQDENQTLAIMPVSPVVSRKPPPARRNSFSGASGFHSIASSKASHASSILRIELQLEEELGGLEEQLDEKEQELELLENKKTVLGYEVEAMKRELIEVQDEGLKIIIAENLQRGECELKKLQSDVEALQIGLKYSRKTFERKSKLLQKKASCEKMVLEEEANDDDQLSQHLSEEDDDPFYQDVDATMKMTDQTIEEEREVLLIKLNSQTAKSEAILSQQKTFAIQISEEDKEVEALSQELLNIGTKDANDEIGTSDMRARFRKIKQPTNLHSEKVVTFMHKEAKPVDANVPKDVSSPINSDFSQLVNAMTQAFVQATGQSTCNSTDKFLARQVHGKDLPIYTGRPEEWIQFITCYQNTTTTCRFEDSDNLNRLQKCLKGDALKAVQCLLSSPSNVKDIMEILKMRFGQPRHIVDSLVEKARILPAFKEDRLECLIEFGTSVKNIATAITALNCPGHLNNPTLLKELENKMPVSFRMRWMKWLIDDSSRTQDLHNFSKWIEGEARLACLLCPPKVKIDDKNGNEGWGNRRRDYRVLTAVEQNPSQKRKERACAFCKSTGHGIWKCELFEKESVKSRRKWIREKNHCYSCLNGGHQVSKCKFKKQCGVNQCDQYHHPWLHWDKPVQAIPEISCHAFKKDDNGKRVHLLILPVKLEGPKGVVSTFAMLDPGATCTLIDEDVAEKLGLQGPRKPLSIQGLHPKVDVPKSKSVGLNIITADGLKTFPLQNVRTLKNIPLPTQSVTRKLLQRWEHTKNKEIATYCNGRPTILIGQDNSKLINGREYEEGEGNAPDVVRTALGWILCGKTQETLTTETTLMLFDEEQDKLHQLVKAQFSVDAIGVKVTAEKPRGVEDRKAQQIMDDTIKNCGDYWETGLLWKSEDIKFPPSKNMAINRLCQMEKKMDRDSDFAKQYQAKIEEYINKGFARKLTKEEACVENDTTFYLSHFMARNPKKPKKLRFVFDAAAKIGKMCFNDALLKGPDQLTCLPAVLFKFRERAIGITADIQDMFHRVHIRKEDSSAQRFLWRSLDRENPPEVYEMSVLIFGAACSPALAQEVKNRNAKQFVLQYPQAVSATLNKFYVDDYLDSCDNHEDAMTRFTEIRAIHNKGSFNLCNWISNSSAFMRAIPQELKLHGAEVKSIDEELSNQIERVLGLFWKPEVDVFTFSLSFLKVKEDLLKKEKLPTKREILALVMSIYDPLGFLTLFTIKAKMLMQEVWRTKIGWDDEIPQSCQVRWETWISELEDIRNFQLPRCYSPNFSTANFIELHMFCDASEQAYGAVAYFRICKNEDIQVSFVTARARVAPLKPLSIPRMELQAAVVGCRLATFITNEHEVKINRVIFWSDSRTVLCWLKADGKSFKQFVSHRVGEIQETTDCQQWRWVPTKENVADELTRDKAKSDWSPTSRWVQGPQFLLEPEESWPKEKNEVSVAECTDEAELRKDFVGAVFSPSCLIKTERFSNWNRMIRATAYLLRTQIYFRKKRENRRGKIPLSPEEIEKAVSWWLRVVQQETFPEEINLLKNGLQIPKSSRLAKLSAYLDDKGILRVRGRLERADVLAHSTKYPVILDSKHNFTKLLVMRFHRDAGHHGQECVVNEIRQQYHILNVRAAVKDSWYRCQMCKNARVKPAVPEMAPLPSIRLLSHVSPFTNTGLDYFGPLEVTVGRHHEKRYVALFTCLSTRAIHLEVARTLNTDSCIMAIRRFISRRGCPIQIQSDNGTNFHGANNELKLALMELDQEAISNTCTNKGIAWKFNTPAAPHMGGSWERMVRATKVALEATLKERCPTDEVLNTLLVEAEHSVNCHPLTHVPVDPDDPEALTPNHFLIGKSSNVPPFGRYEVSNLCLRKMWRRSQALADMFWRRWVKEYLPTILRRTKWFHSETPIAVGDIVIEVSPQLPRNSWPMGKVIKLYPSPDQQVRSVDVQFKSSVLKRPVAKLCILDVRREDNELAASGKSPESITPKDI